MMLYSLRAIYGLDDVRLGIHVAESAEAAHREIDLFFPYEDHHKSQGYLAFKEQTAAIIKPDAVQTGKVDALLAKIQEQGFNIQRRKEVQFTPEKVKEFYSEHLEKPFFNDLVAYMTRYIFNTQRNILYVIVVLL
jgi:nucleoside diphosphate kinase